MKIKIFAFLWLFFAIFASFFVYKNWENIEILFGFSFEKNPKIDFNKSLELAKNWEYSKALEILPNEIPENNEKILELKWDILYAQNADSWSILENYEKSLEIKENERVREKIALIKSPPKSENTEERWSQNLQESPENWSDEVQKTRGEISKDQEKREDFLNTTGDSRADFEADLQNIKNFLSNGETSEQKDW